MGKERIASFFNRASPALVELLLKYSVEKPKVIDHHLYEFGSVRYHIQASASDPQNIYLSILTPPLSSEFLHSNRLPDHTIRDIERTYYDLAEIVEPPKEGFILTLRLHHTKLPHFREDRIKAITSISSIQAVILSSQLKDLLWNLGSQDHSSYGMYKPIRLVYHPREPFFVIRMPEKVVAIFPMRFKDDSDVVLARTIFQELMDAGYSVTCDKAPPCTWSPIPPPELRGESFQHLRTNGGFVSFEFFSQHARGLKVEKTVWVLLNFYAYVKHHVKCTRSFIQRKMRQRLESLTEVLQKARIEHNDHKKVHDRKCVRKLPSFSKSKMLRRKFGAFTKHIKRIHSPIRIKGLDRFRRQWLRIPNFATLRRYTKLD